MSSLFNQGYALLIGVGADLPVTIKDATAIHDLLIDPNKAGYPIKQVRLITETAATRQQILAEFDKLIKWTDDNPEAIVIVYYSGHGFKIKHTNEPHEYFLVPYGFDISRRESTAISGLEFTAKIEAINALKLIILLDCCHAGGIPSLKTFGEEVIKTPLPASLLDVLKTGRGRVIITSSREDEYSYTGDPYSIFTACLLEALEGRATVSKDGFARILDTLIYLFDQVPKRAGRSGGLQHPFVKKVLDLGDNFPICYYAGGNKSVPDKEDTIEFPLQVRNLTLGKRARLKRKLDGLQNEWDLRAEKIHLMRNDYAIEVGTAIRFQLEQQLLREESRLAELQLEIEEIEELLQEPR